MSGIEHQPEAGADARCPKLRHITLNEAHVQPGFPHPLVRAPQRLADDVDARDLPAALR